MDYTVKVNNVDVSIVSIRDLFKPFSGYQGYSYAKSWREESDDPHAWGSSDFFTFYVTPGRSTSNDQYYAYVRNRADISNVFKPGMLNDILFNAINSRSDGDNRPVRIPVTINNTSYFFVVAKSFDVLGSEDHDIRKESGNYTFPDSDYKIKNSPGFTAEIESIYVALFLTETNQQVYICPTGKDDIDYPEFKATSSSYVEGSERPYSAYHLIDTWSNDYFGGWLILRRVKNGNNWVHANTLMFMYVNKNFFTNAPYGYNIHISDAFESDDNKVLTLQYETVGVTISSLAGVQYFPERLFIISNIFNCNPVMTSKTWDSSGTTGIVPSTFSWPTAPITIPLAFLNEFSGSAPVPGGETSFMPIKAFNLLSDTLLYTIYLMTKEDVRKFSMWMWDSANLIESLKKWNDKPIENIISLGLLPFPIVPIDSRQMIIGNLGVTDENGSPLNVGLIFRRTDSYPLGTITIPHKYNNFLDYQPYTSVSIFLPYVGFVDLNADDVMGATLDLWYTVDCATGDFVASINVIKTEEEKGGEQNSVRYEFPGNMMTKIPLTSYDAGQNTFKALSGIGKIAAGSVVATAVSPVAGVAAGVSGFKDIGEALLKHDVSHGQYSDGNIGLLGGKRPFVVINYPAKSEPSEYGNLNGYVAEYTALLSTLSGFTVVKKIHLENIDATSGELEELERLLSEGVVL